MNLKYLIMAVVAVLFSFNALVAGEAAPAEGKAEATKVECVGKVTCTKNADGTCTTTVTAEDGTVYTVCSKCEACKKVCELDGKTVKLAGKCEDGKNVCVASCEECKDDAAEAPAK